MNNEKAAIKIRIMDKVIEDLDSAFEKEMIQFKAYSKSMYAKHNIDYNDGNYKSIGIQSSSNGSLFNVGSWMQSFDGFNDNINANMLIVSIIVLLLVMFGCWNILKNCFMSRFKYNKYKEINASNTKNYQSI